MTPPPTPHWVRVSLAVSAGSMVLALVGCVLHFTGPYPWNLVSWAMFLVGGATLLLSDWWARRTKPAPLVRRYPRLVLLKRAITIARIPVALLALVSVVVVIALSVIHGDGGNGEMGVPILAQRDAYYLDAAHEHPISRTTFIINQTALVLVTHVLILVFPILVWNLILFGRTSKSE